jgi:hypothetical protein
VRRLLEAGHALQVEVTEIADGKGADHGFSEDSGAVTVSLAAHWLAYRRKQCRARGLEVLQVPVNPRIHEAVKKLVDEGPEVVPAEAWNFPFGRLPGADQGIEIFPSPRVRRTGAIVAPAIQKRDTEGKGIPVPLAKRPFKPALVKVLPQIPATGGQGYIIEWPLRSEE